MVDNASLQVLKLRLLVLSFPFKIKIFNQFIQKDLLFGHIGVEMCDFILSVEDMGKKSSSTHRSHFESVVFDSFNFSHQGVYGWNHEHERVIDDAEQDVIRVKMATREEVGSNRASMFIELCSLQTVSVLSRLFLFYVLQIKVFNHHFSHFS